MDTNIYFRTPVVKGTNERKHRNAAFLTKLTLFVFDVALDDVRPKGGRRRSGRFPPPAWRRSGSWLASCRSLSSPGFECSPTSSPAPIRSPWNAPCSGEARSSSKPLNMPLMSIAECQLNQSTYRCTSMSCLMLHNSLRMASNWGRSVGFWAQHSVMSFCRRRGQVIAAGCENEGLLSLNNIFGISQFSTSWKGSNPVVIS